MPVRPAARGRPPTNHRSAGTRCTLTVVTSLRLPSTSVVSATSCSTSCLTAGTCAGPATLRSREGIRAPLFMIRCNASMGGILLGVSARDKRFIGRLRMSYTHVYDCPSALPGPAARLRGRGAPPLVHEGGAGASRDAIGGEPADQDGRGPARGAAVPPHEPRAPPHRGGSDAGARGGRRAGWHRAGRRAGVRAGRRAAAHRHYVGVIRGVVAGAAPRAPARSAPGYRCPPRGEQ